MERIGRENETNTPISRERPLGKPTTNTRVYTACTQYNAYAHGRKCETYVNTCEIYRVNVQSVSAISAYRARV